MKEHTTITQALVITGGVGVLLVGGLSLAWPRIALDEQNASAILSFTILLAVTFFLVVVYQMFRSKEQAQALADRMTKDMLSSSHELFFELYRSSPVPYLVIGERGIIESTNLATARLFGVDVSIMDGKNLFDFISDVEGHESALLPEYIARGNAINDLNASITRPDGALRHVSLSHFSFKNPEKQRKGLVTLIDITKQKMVDKAKTEFVSLASHQLRTPISAMKWNVELLKTTGKDSLTEASQSYVEKITRSLERMDTLVQDFLSASKLELGTLTAQRAIIDLPSFLKSVCEEYQITAEKKKVHIETEWESAQGSISSDAHLLHMIVSNIVGNAVKYTKEEGTVRFAVVKDVHKLTIRVSDNGIGIPEEDQGMIFSKLFRATNAREQVTDGTGLGLYIVKEAVEILNGTISFESKAGLGTTFTVILPQ